MYPRIYQTIEENREAEVREKTFAIKHFRGFTHKEQAAVAHSWPRWRLGMKKCPKRLQRRRSGCYDDWKLGSKMEIRE